MAKYPISVNIKKTPLKAAAPKIAAAKPVAAAKPNVGATLKRAERAQAMEAGESRLARSMPPKNKPATPTMSAAAKAKTQATLSRAERMQREEAIGDALLMKRGKPNVIRTTVNERTTPAKKK